MENPKTIKVTDEILNYDKVFEKYKQDKPKITLPTHIVKVEIEKWNHGLINIVRYGLTHLYETKRITNVVINTDDRIILPHDLMTRIKTIRVDSSAVSGTIKLNVVNKTDHPKYVYTTDFSYISSGNFSKYVNKVPMFYIGQGTQCEITAEVLDKKAAKSPGVKYDFINYFDRRGLKITNEKNEKYEEAECSEIEYSSGSFEFMYEDFKSAKQVLTETIDKIKEAIKDIDATVDKRTTYNINSIILDVSDHPTGIMANFLLLYFYYELGRKVLIYDLDKNNIMSQLRFISTDKEGIKKAIHNGIKKINSDLDKIKAI